MVKVESTLSKPETPGAAVREFESSLVDSENTDHFEGPSLFEIYGHLFGTVHGGPNDVAEHPEKYIKGFGATRL